MKIIIGLVISLFLAGLAYTLQKQEPIEYVAPKIEAPQEIIKQDSVSEAQKQLDEAKRLLDEEDAKLRTEITAIEQEAKVKVAEKELRLEEIRKVRLSFSQAPEPVN